MFAVNVTVSPTHGRLAAICSSHLIPVSLTLSAITLSFSKDQRNTEWVANPLGSIHSYKEEPWPAPSFQVLLSCVAGWVAIKGLIPSNVLKTIYRDIKLFHVLDLCVLASLLATRVSSQVPVLFYFQLLRRKGRVLTMNLLQMQVGW